MSKYTTETFILKAKLKFGNKFNYDKVDYINCTTNIIITCPIHGDFITTPVLFLSSKYGCKQCAIDAIHKKETYTTKLFIENAVKIYGNKFDYGKVNYINSNTKVCIICPIHGEFYIRPADFLRGHNCPKCRDSNTACRNKLLKRNSQQEFILKANSIHNNKYNYNKTKYINSRTKLIITCPIHGDFSVLPSHHLQGSGCPLCNSSIGENKIRNILLSLNLEFIELFKVNDTRTYFIDFYLPKHNLFIEYHGELHFHFVKKFGEIDNFYKQINRDYDLRDYCFINNINLLELYYYHSKEDLVNRIKKSCKIN